ncbi:hypothetical protein [Edaphobacter modestus]|uniref:ImpB/mucB/samB family protein n=1 Tax=Edaphobacter modestus TaxID=388466 RepID=A0A4Q7Z0M9_9BACT|nr:impB/mucB/samB family protein [Edaphobacter modestus]
MYAVLHPPNFAAQVAAQQRPELRKCPFVLIDGEPPTKSVFAANKAARSLGVEVGMTRLQAESIPDILPFLVCERTKVPRMRFFTPLRACSRRELSTSKRILAPMLSTYRA